MLTLGIDEAGRGAVIGPLVVCGAVFDESDLPKLKELGVKDSKQLSPGRREHLKERIGKLAKLIVIEKLQPWEIDERRGDGTNLNRLETLEFLRIINKAFERFEINRVVIDVPDPNLRKYKTMISNLVKREGLEIVAEHYADSKYVECSAASIMAKVTRDAETEALKPEYGDFGAGYPSDPKCIGWIKDRLAAHGELPRIVRHSWETVSEILKNRSQKDLKRFFGKG